MHIARHYERRGFPPMVTPGAVEPDILDGGDAKRLQLKRQLRHEAPRDGVDTNAPSSVELGFNNGNPDPVYAPSHGIHPHNSTGDRPLGALTRRHESPESLADLEPLGEAIRRCTQTSSGQDDLRFLPVDELERLITCQAVCQQLRRDLKDKSHKELNSLAEKICDEVAPSSSNSGALTTRKKIFATLVLIDKVDAIEAFVEWGLYDVHLPFYLPDPTSHLRDNLYRLSTHEGKETKVSIILFSDWSYVQRENFAKYQWQFLAPFFDTVSGENSRPLHYVLEDSRVLPFVEDFEGKGPEPVISGGYSEVWRVKIHPAHHRRLSKTNPYFAVKRLRPSVTHLETFKREVATFKRLSRQNHHSLMRLQLTYVWRGHCHLLFQWADGNLKDFWQRHPGPGDIPRSHGFAIWVAQQLLGLTQGLQVIHSCSPDPAPEHEAGEDEYAAKRTRGRHGDLKPENILWFKQDQELQCNTPHPHHQGRLVISDFGLTQFHRDKTGRVNPVNVGRTPTYRPPEYDVCNEITQSFDIWTWGCVLLEFSVWYLKGFEAWDAFSRERTDEHRGGLFQEDVYFSVETKIPVSGGQPLLSARLKKSVIKQYARLRNDPKISQFLIDILDLIELKLLRMNPDERGKCEQVVKELEDIYKKCTDSEEYSVKPIIPGTEPNQVYTDNLELLAQPAEDRPKMSAPGSIAYSPTLVGGITDQTSNDVVQAPPAIQKRNVGHGELSVRSAHENTNPTVDSKAGSQRSGEKFTGWQGHLESQPSMPTNEPRTAGLQARPDDLSQRHSKNKNNNLRDDGKGSQKWWHVFICGFRSWP